ncbi:MAG: BamA/TamA family outer membrane protein [Synechococcaceae cyanobacterium RL_1_2]|nr:BamA/TamA family outer membrane protein [Synechococcaceae cyanobacterium RL_1_2]
MIALQNAGANVDGKGQSLSEILISQQETRVLVAEVNVVGANGIVLDRKLIDTIYDAISTRAGLTASRSQLQEDVDNIFETGLFADAVVIPEDTPLGVKITFQVLPNPVLQKVEIEAIGDGSSDRILEDQTVNEIFSDQYGKPLNLNDLQDGIKELNQWYLSQGYDLAQVLGDAQVDPTTGIVNLIVAEGVIESIQVNYLDEEDQPTEGKTKPYIITREIELKPGDVFNGRTAQRDLQRVFGLGLFDDAALSFSPANDPSKVIVNVNVKEGSTGSVAAGAGLSSASGLFGTVSYQQQNFGGRNQTLGLETQLGTQELLFNLSFSDPWIANDPRRTGYTIDAFRRRSVSFIFDGGPNDINLPNGEQPRIRRTGGGINFSRPLSDPFERSEWNLSTGFRYQKIEVVDEDGNISPLDENNQQLSFSNDGTDDLVTLQFGATQDKRDNPLQPTKGSVLRFGTEQSIPIGSGSIFFNRLRGSYSTYFPTKILGFAEDKPETLAFNVQAGTIIGDTPPYEAFSLGGSNSVRGYEEGDVGSGKSYLQMTAEYRFPLFSVLGGAFFVDYATDLGSGSSVPGDPAGRRGKPGDGLGYGAGVRIQSPLGPIRIDYGFNDQGDNRIHFGIGERF